MGPPTPIAVRPYVNLSALYSSGISGVQKADGTFASNPVYGGEIAGGLYGYRTWRRTVLGINYRGDYRYYDRNAGYINGTSHFAMLGLTHRPTRRMSFDLRAGLGTMPSQNMGYLGTFGFYNSNFANIPRDEVLNTRTTYLTAMADMTYLLSARLSVNLGGSEFIVRRQKSSLYAMTGTQGRVDLAYRLTRRTTLAVDYFYTHYGYYKMFGDGNMHSVGLNYSVTLSPRWSFGIRAGGMRVETLAIGTVPVDPEVAAIIGRTQGHRTQYALQYRPSFTGQLSHRSGHTSVTGAYTYGAAPGNGVYLTSRQSNADLSYSYAGMRRWSLTASASYSRLHSVGQDIGRYQSVSAGFGASRSVGRGLYLTARGDGRRSIVSHTYRKVYYTATLGVAYSPGDVPLRLW